MKDVNEPNAPHRDQPRYQVVPESQSGHCCFEATVVDATRPDLRSTDGKHYQDSDGYLRYKQVCECFDLEDAKRIAAALNNVGP